MGLAGHVIRAHSQTAAMVADSTAVSLFEDGMCNFSSGPCALFPGPAEPVHRNMASGYLPCIIAMNGIVPPVHDARGGSPVRAIAASLIASLTLPPNGGAWNQSAHESGENVTSEP